MPNDLPSDASDEPTVPRSQHPAVGDPAVGENGGRPALSPRARIAGAQDAAPSLSDAEQTLADSDQTLAGADQTRADSDQTSADGDQTSADRDQLASDRDQAASDHDLALGADARAHEFSREIRERTTHEREHTAQARLQAASLRDTSARARDLVALARDDAADARDLAMAQRDAAAERESGARAMTGAEIVLRAAQLRKRAARDRAHSAEQRELAAQDRHAGAHDREQGAHERAQAAADREALAHQLANAETDPLTAARSRAAGLRELDRELDRCRHTSGGLVVAHVDVVDLKALNSNHGHGPGDELLKHVVATLREHLRSYDLIIRLGGDEFLCAMSNMTLPAARRRFSQVAAALATSPIAGAIRTGFAELTRDERIPELIARADSGADGQPPYGRRRPVMTQPLAAQRESDERSRGAPLAALSLVLGGGPLAPARARAAIYALAGDIAAGQLEVLELLISELVTNSVVHGAAGPADRIIMQITVCAHSVHGAVSDPGCGYTPSGPPKARDVGGLGLVIVDRCTTRWGTSHGGRRVWFDLDRTDHDHVARSGDRNADCDCVVAEPENGLMRWPARALS